MGQYLDGLVDRLKGFSKRRDSLYASELNLGMENPSVYLDHLVRESSLFELPFSSKETFDRFEGDKAAFCDALRGYMELSRTHGQFFITPFPLTAIEDNESVVFLDYQGGSTFRTTALKWEKRRRSLAPNDAVAGPNHPLQNLIFSGDVEIVEVADTGVMMNIIPLYFHLGSPRKIDIPAAERENMRQYLTVDLSNSTIVAMREMLYIMDPKNFIIRLETNAYRATQNRLDMRGKANKKLRKTADRPVYRVLSKNELLKLAEQSSLESVCFHPVEGYSKTLTSEVFKNMRGQKLQIPQHFKGEGIFDANKGGMHYEVYIKLSPTHIVPFSQYAPTRK